MAIPLNTGKSANCASCGLRELCVPAGMSPEELQKLDGLVATRRQIRRDETLFRAGDGFQSLYAVRAGFFKTSAYGKESKSQITGFQLSGDVLGLDGLTDAKHHVDVIALEDSEVCAIFKVSRSPLLI